MDPMVSARVPIGLRDQVNKRLREIGSTPTELINRAYEFFITTGSLPGKKTEIEPGTRRLDASQLGDLKQSILMTTHPVDESFFADREYNDALESELRREYEALS